MRSVVLRIALIAALSTTAVFGQARILQTNSRGDNVHVIDPATNKVVGEIKGLPAKKIIAALLLDKKVKAGRINFILPEKVGKVVIRDDVPVSVIKQVLLELGAK